MSDLQRQVPRVDLGFLAGDGEMVELIRSKDWTETPLGPIESWPQSLRTTVSLCLASNFPINIVWGSQHTQIYNDGYRVLCGKGHPAVLGSNYAVYWASAWSAIGQPFDRALGGETSFLENQRMFLERNGYLEETFFTFSLSPIRDESGHIGGLFHPVTETTAAMVSERRTRAVRDLTAHLSESHPPIRFSLWPLILLRRSRSTCHSCFSTNWISAPTSVQLPAGGPYRTPRRNSGKSNRAEFNRRHSLADRRTGPIACRHTAGGPEEVCSAHAVRTL